MIKFTKQSNGKHVTLGVYGSNAAEIEQEFIGLYNWNCVADSGADLGCPERFVYVGTTETRFIGGMVSRFAKRHLEALEGARMTRAQKVEAATAQAALEAKALWDSIPEEEIVSRQGLAFDAAYKMGVEEGLTCWK